MPLIKCPDCGKEISSRAKACPFCGCPSEYFADTTDSSSVSVINKAEEIEDKFAPSEEKMNDVKATADDGKTLEGESATASAIKDTDTSIGEENNGSTLEVASDNTPVDEMIRRRNASDNKYRFKLADHVLEYEEGDYKWINIYGKLWKALEDPYMAYRIKLSNYDIKTRIANMVSDNQGLIDSWSKGVVDVLNDALGSAYTVEDIKQAEPDIFTYEPSGNANTAMNSLKAIKDREKMVRGMKVARFLTFQKDDRKNADGELRGYQSSLEEEMQRAEEAAKEVAFDMLEYLDKIVGFVTETIEEHKDMGSVNTYAFHESIEELQCGLYEESIYNGFYIYLAEMGSIYQMLGARYLLENYYANGATFDEAREIVSYFNRYQYDRWAYDKLEEWIKDACRGLISKEDRYKRLLDLAYKADVIDSDNRLVNICSMTRDRDICFTKLIESDVIKEKPYNSIEEWIRKEAPTNGDPVLKELRDYCNKYHLLEEGPGLVLKTEYAKCPGIFKWFISIVQVCRETSIITEIPQAETNESARVCSKCGAAISAGSKFCPSCGQPVRESNGETGNSTIDSRVQSFIASGDKIKAIRAYMEKNGVGLKEAKDFIEKLMK